MAEYRGNTVQEIARALNDGRTRLVLHAGQMAQVVEEFNRLVEKNNVLVRELHDLTPARPV